jgi:hypothetical protein
VTNTVQTLNGLFKEVYADRIVDLVPEGTVLLNEVEFVREDQQPGNLYHQPVVLSQEQGVTYSAANSGAFTLENPVAAVHRDAQVTGTNIVLRSAIGYEAAARASTGGKRAFVKATQQVVRNMLKGISRRNEVAMMYGGTSLAAIESVSGSGTTRAWVISNASWAPGIWAGAENALLDVYTSNFVTQRNANAVVTVTSVDMNTRTINVSGNSTDLTAIVATDTLFYRGARNNECTGIDGIITNTGTLFNIDSSAFNMWRGNVYGCGNSQLTMGKILAGLSQASDRGLDDGAMILVPAQSWANLNNDLAALRVLDSSYSPDKLKNGTKSIEYSSECGDIVIKKSNFVKRGEAFAIPLSRARRIGASDITFNNPGNGDKFFLELANSAGYELRSYSNQAIFIETPAHCVKFTNIVASP